MDLTAYCHRLAFFTAMKQSQQVLTKKTLMVMKLTAIILLAACLQLSARGVSQTLTLSFKNASLEKVFSEIQRQTGYSFFYEDGLLKNARLVDILVVKASIVQVLDMCFVNQPFTYKIVNTAISVRRKEQIIEASFKAAPETGDPVTVSGKVTDEKGNPLVGANVKVKGSNLGTTTDNLGRFTLANLNENSILEITFVGHDAQSFNIKGKNFLTIALVQKQSILDETVVIAYGTSSRRFTTGNIATIKAADIEKSPVQNPLLALQGRVPGIEITQLTGMNGGGVNVRIQGQNSMFNSNNPLIVVDGVPFPAQFVGTNSSIGLENIVQGGSPLNYINPNDIESIDILKDADATAIYGSRAANGAILITTKKGKSGRAKLTLNLQQGWGNVGHFVDMMNRRQYLDMRYEAFRNDGIAIATLLPGFNNYDVTVWDTSRSTNWQKTLLGGTSKYSNFQIGLSGGTAAVQYLIGATFNRQTTVYPGDFDNKVGNLHFNINGASANQRLKLQLTGSYGYDQNQLPGVDLTNQALLLEPVAPALFKEDGTINWAPSVTGSSTWNNPLAYTQNTDFSNTTKNMISNVNIIYSIISGLDFQTSFGYSNTLTELYTPYRIGTYAPEIRSRIARTASFGNRATSSWIIEPQLQYSGKIGRGKLEGLLGSSIQKNAYTYLAVDGSGFLTDLLMKTLRAASSTSIRLSLTGITRYNALFGRLGYNWADKYLISLTARRDGSNKFGAKNRFHNFYSVGIGWIFSEEKWMTALLPFLSFGKL
jgi:TonB-linked SusC/RagA family outer membrane protein